MLRMKQGFEHIAEDFWREPGCDYRLVVREAFSAYSQWWESEARHPPLSPGALPGDFARTLRVGEQQRGWGIILDGPGGTGRPGTSAGTD